MPLEPGTRIGGYTIIEAIGAGGMGEIYRAHDPRLERDVAIKVLPGKSATDPTAVARLEREARAASALNHPHILTIYDIGAMETSGVFVAMEFIHGETLRSRFRRHESLETRLDYLVQVADGLAKAHAAGIVHRDLKPDNVMINSDGFAKILDFGLATKTESAEHTELMPLTREGTVVGTMGYIAPEQWAGDPADARTDIFAFGCVAYEAITNARAFHGHPTADPPALRTFAPDTPPPLERIVSRCLARSREDRYATMKEVVNDLRSLREQIRNPQQRPLARPVQVTFDRAVEQFPAISHDGARVVFSRDIGKIRNLFMKQLDDEGDESQLTSGDLDDIQPSWSPRGDALLFLRGREHGERIEPSDVFGRYIGGDIWMLDIASGKTSLLVSDAANPSWSPDGKHIAFDASWSGQRRIWIADERGRNPSQLTSGATEAVHHVRPRWARDGKKIVFQTLEGTKFDVAVVDVDSKKTVAVTNDYTMDIHPVWSPDGESIYFSSYRGGGINVWRADAGTMEQITAGPGHDIDLDISPTGRLVFAIMKQNADIWRLPVDPTTGAATGAPEPVIATTRENSRGAWSADGSTIAFSSDRGGEMNLWLLPVNEKKPRQLTRGEGGDFQPSWSPDAKSLAFFSGRSGALEIWRFDLDGGALTQLTSDDGININPFFSPDGARIAFMSDRDGRLEVWVMNADGSDPRQLTNEGVIGHFLRWSADGSHIFFRSPKARTMSVPLAGGDASPTAEVVGGAHMSLSPDQSMIMDVVAHRTLWVSPLDGGARRRVFEFEDPESRIDYPVWSPDGRWVLFDRFVPRGGDVWMLDT
jgi:Tol biopolymer transport system component/predicted Ser/Thr protein kinase